MKWFTVLSVLVAPLATVASPLVPRQNGNVTAAATATSTATGTTPANGTSSSSSNSTTTAGGARVPVVTLYPDTSNGLPIEVAGVSAPQFGQDWYLGIPFAQPPVGDLRFAPPQSYTYNFSVTAQKQPPACLQDPSGTSDAASQSEDCLYLNVFAPQGANASTAYLPVMVWVYGGSFTSGSASLYNATFLEAYAAQTGKPFIFVAVNYRLGAFGWGYGSGFAENGAANLGLRDIRKGLEWVQENIWAFGGNPDQVTVFGESAGAIAISLLYLDPNINLFKSAIMESGAQSTFPLGPTGSTWDDAYQYLLKATNCSTAGNATAAAAANTSTSANTTAPVSNSTSVASNNASTPWQCLKNLPAQALLKGQLTVKSNLLFAGFVYGPSIDGDVIPDSPHTLLSQGKFARIPFISGNNKDEGTSFVPQFVNSTAAALAVVNLFEPRDPSNETLAQLFALYPPVASAGSPFDTGNNTFGLSAAWKQATAIVGDATFQANRRYFIRQANQYGFDQTWTYQFEQLTPGQPPIKGVYHASEIPYVYGAARPSIGFPGFSTNYTQADASLSNTMMDYWLNFAYYTNPNGNGATGSSNATYWPNHDTNQNNKNMLRLLANNVTVFQDDYREEQMQFLLNNPEQFNYKRGL
ncbi:hypothetical protein CI109_106143 [Kwoniella shandongensis]|uniref:Carboxylic ester hydrolase n=1 Tax=Kwoniella shandongensis TaxID=1734106 RepID=A0A5M6BZU8_9TREE|nr:uncharacterized protein CI109_003751 [Kwoniella shandongensis]KAA5527780.1 hypothetical protein CI109_003751 [Kwoniella shandongensis]